MRVLSVSVYKPNFQQDKHNQIKKNMSNPHGYGYEISNQYSPVTFKSVLEKIPVQKNKLLKQFDEILKQDRPELNYEEWELKTIDIATRFYKNKTEQALKIISTIERLAKLPFKSAQEALNEVNRLKKEYKRIMNGRPAIIMSERSTKNQETFDYALINRFKNAILDGNYNLRKVFYDYYKPIADIKTIEELNEKFPLIKTPRRPEEVVSEKIVSKFDRSFYKELDDYIENNEMEKASDLTMQAAVKILSGVYGSNDIPISNSTAQKFLRALVNKAADRYYYHRLNNSLNSIPTNIKVDKNLFSKHDLSLLGIDYDDFVLAVIKEQYLHFNKPIDVIYKVLPDSDFCIKVSDLRDTEYKFGKVNEKIKKMISDAEKIKTEERKYNLYSESDFRKRLAYYTEIFGDDEGILERMVEFDSSRFTPEDKSQLGLMLNELDKVFDGEQLIGDARNNIYRREIRAHGTYKLNNSEREAALKKAKEEQKLAAALKQKQKEFDDLAEILYQNNLSYTAEIYSKFRPKTLEDKEYLSLMRIVENHIKDSKIDNTKKLQAEVIYWNKYIEYKHSNSENALISKAEQFASHNGHFDKIKAGQYLLNSEILQNYPENKEYLNNTQIIDKILESCFNDKTKAVGYLCKYNDYEILNPTEKSSIYSILNIFDMKDTTEKALVKNIIENEYTKIDTKKIASLNESKFVETTISAKAKQEIMDYYKFPKCVEFYKDFEDAMTTFAKTKASAGTKKLGKNNNKLSNVYELKIKGRDDRLVAYNGTYYFDEFKSTGFHKSNINL